MAKDKNSGNMRKLAAKVTILFDFGMIIASLICMHMRGVDNLEPLRAMNVGIDLVGMIIGFVILLSCYVDMQRVGIDYKYFRYLVESTFIGLFMDIGAWLMKNRPDFWFLNRLDNSLFFLTMPATVFFFWRYVTQIIGRKDPFIDKAEFWIKLGFAVEIILCVANFPLGFFFTVDHTGSYSRGAFFPVFMLYIVFVGLIGVILIIMRRERLTRHQIAALAVYLATPLPVILISIFIYGLSLNYVMCMLDTLVMYCILNIEQGREKFVVQQELATASSIQEGVLPHVFPLFPDRNEFELHASMDPAKDVGGDFYDAFLIDDDHLALVIADVSGKGIPAALFMLISKTLIKNRALMGGTPAEILTDVNPRLFEGNKERLFVTVWLGILTISTGQVIETNAGHESPAIRRANGEFELLKRKHGVVLGGFKKAKYTDDEFELQPGDSIFVYTDGVPEATDEKKERFGKERMLTALNLRPDEKPVDLLTTVRVEVDKFVGTAPQFDDLTMLAVKYEGGAKE